MPNLTTQNLAKLLDTQTNLGATTTTAFTLHAAESYTFIIDAAAGAGTSPTLDVSIEFSPDGGTTFYSFAKCTQVTTSAKKYAIPVRPSPVASAAPSVTDITVAAGSTAFSLPAAVTGKCQINYIVGGTTPNFSSVKVWVVESARAEGAAGFVL